MTSIIALITVLFCTSCHPRSSNRDVEKSVDRILFEYSQGQYPQVLEDIDRIQPTMPSNYLIYEIRAWTFHQMDRDGKNDTLIISNLNTAIELAPLKAAQSYHLRGLISDRQGNAAAAINDYSKAIEIMPTDPNTYYSYIERGILYGMQSDHVAAINDAKHAIELRPDKYRPYLVMTKAYQELGNLDEAVKYLTVASRMVPSNNIVIELKKELGVEW